MALLDAMASARGGEVAAVAIYDHGTGPAARRAVGHVDREAERRGLAVVTGASPGAGPAREAAWRDARWRFLAGWARELGAVVLTAHTRDDQVETVVQRLLRDAGPRGLAGMRTASVGPHRTPVMRPLLTVSRATVAAYVAARRIVVVEDPSNARRAHQRNRIRLDLLPALERAAPGFAAWCLDLAARAGAWSDAVDRLLDELGLAVPAVGVAVLPTARTADLGAGEWSVLLPAMAARIGIAMDRRGIARAAAWLPRAGVGARIPLSGGAAVERHAATVVVRRDGPGTPGGMPDYIFPQ